MQKNSQGNLITKSQNETVISRDMSKQEQSGEEHRTKEHSYLILRYFL